KLYAINKRNGDIIWQVQRDEPSNWGTPLVIDHDGKKQIVLTGQNKARAYDLMTGSALWECGGQTQRPAASPVAGNGLVFVGSGFRGSFLGAFRPDGRGDIEGSEHVAWTLNRDTPDIGSPLLSGNRLYFYKGKSGLLSCVDAATGNAHYMTQRIRNLDSIYASPVAAGGNVYLSDRDGTVVVIKDDDKLQVLATNSMGETIDATPAPVDNQLFIRGVNHLFCIEES
ncbi:MAG: PQQ-binding-like beta-propeller repeat protein, partial [Planctomycetota bacterium]